MTVRAWILICVVLGSSPAVRASLLEDDLARRPWITFQIQPGPEGVKIGEIAKGGAAEKGGLLAGDKLVRIGERPVRGPMDVGLSIAGRKVGEKIAIAVERGGKPVEVSITLEAFPKETGEGFETAYGSVVAGGHKLRTILTKPVGAGPFPAVFVVQGIGCFSLDNVPFKSSYKTITDELTRRGFATLRIDKPGTGDSEGGPCPAVPFHAEVQAFQAALVQLSKLSAIDKSRLSIFGHSLGGVMAPLIAQAAQVASIAVFGTAYGSWLAFELDNGHRGDLLEGKPPAEVARMDAIRERFVTLLYVEDVPLPRIAKEQPELAREIGVPAGGGSYAGGKPGSYTQEIYKTNFAKAWTDYTGRVVAVFGKSDFVSNQGVHELLVEEVNLVHPGRARLELLDGVDHWFNALPTMKESAKVGSDGEMSPAVLQALPSWFR